MAYIHNDEAFSHCDECGTLVCLDGENDGVLIGGECMSCGYWVSRYVDELDDYRAVVDEAIDTVFEEN